MKDFRDKVAVVTGAASGIGRGLARRCLEEGMKVVLADIEEEALARTEAEMGGPGAGLRAVVADVSEVEEVRALAERTMEAFGGVHLLFNNAGVAAGSSLWESSLNDCRWVIGVNLWGVINCLRRFVPLMLEQNTPGHIVNTSSLAGLSTYHPSALYQLTKHGILALSEQLHHDLAIRGAKVKVSVLCPGFVDTRIMDAERNRPPKYRDDPSGAGPRPGPGKMEEVFRQMVKAGMPPSQVADHVFRAIVEERFFVFTHPEAKPLIKNRMESLLQERNPVLPPMAGP